MPLPRSVLRMTPDELETLLSTERTARVATVSASGEPHVAPMWFIWSGGKLYVNSLRRSRRSSDLEAGSKVAVCVDAGEQYAELRGAVLYGSFADASDDPGLAEIRSMFGAKYWAGIQVPEVRSHLWLTLKPDRIVSWDFSKIPTGKDRRLEALSSDETKAAGQPTGAEATE